MKGEHRVTVKLLALVCILIALGPISTLADGGDASNWVYGMYAYSAFQDSGTYGGVGVRGGATDGYDPSGNDWRIVSGPKAYFGTYHASETDGWSGPPGFYSADTRSPLPQSAGAAKTWVLYVWADPALPWTASSMTFSWANYHPLPAGMSFTLTLLSKPAGITGGPGVGSKYDLASQYAGTVSLPLFRTADGRSGYVFVFTATVIPEPPCLAALFTGLAGFGGVMRRRGG